MSAFKDMRNLLDWSSDVGKQLFHTVKLKHAMPSYVANELRNLDTPDLSKIASERLGAGCKDYTTFAICSPSPRFPCHTKAATWLSTAYYLEQKNDIPQEKAELIERYLTKAATYWRIEDDIAKLSIRHDDLLAKASSACDTMIPLRNSAEVKAAAVWLCDNANEIMYDEGAANLAKMAGEILDKAAAYDQRIEATVKTDLLRLSGRAGCYNGKKVAQVLKTVKTAQADAELLGCLIDTVETTHGEDLQSYHVKLAETLDTISSERRNFLRELATDEPTELLKLANDRFVRTDVLDKLRYKDWMTVGQVGEFTLDGRPDDMSKLSKVQSDRLCKIAAELDKRSVIG